MESPVDGQAQNLENGQEPRPEQDADGHKESPPTAPADTHADGMQGSKECPVTDSDTIVSHTESDAPQLIDAKQGNKTEGKSVAGRQGWRSEASVQVAVGAPTSVIKNADGELIAWDVVRKAIESRECTIPEAAAKFKIPDRTIQSRIQRHKWDVLNAHTLKALRKKQQADWSERAESHRELAFNIAHGAMKKTKSVRIKNARDLELVDKVARRAAGLDTAEIVQQTIVAVNEAIDSEGEPMVIEADVIPDDPATLHSGDRAAEDQPQTGSQ